MNHLNENELVLALDGEMEEAELKQAVDHMAECEECRGRWEKLQGLSERVVEYTTSLYAHPVAQEQKLRDKDGARLRPGVSSFGFRVSSWKWGFAAAAMVLIGVAVAFWNAYHSLGAHPIAQEQKLRDKDGAQSQKPNEVAPTTAAQLAVNSGPSLGLHLAQSASGRVAKNHFKARPVKTTPAADKPDTKLAQFTELPFSDASLPLDQATVVRVTLPAAALRQAGVAVNEDNANAMLKADVVLGMDGLPRGIRLVNQGSSGTN